jgi:hypothetical protein
MPPTSLCPGSLRPVPLLQRGDDAFCEFCCQGVNVIDPPRDGLHDPWRGSKDARLESHGVEKQDRILKIRLLAVFRFTDDSEICFLRSLETPVVPTVGSSISVDGIVMGVTHVHHDVDEDSFVLGVAPDLAFSSPLPRGRTEFIDAVSLLLPGWNVVRPPPHLRLVE